MRRYCSILLILLSLPVFPQKTIIKGNAHSYPAMEICAVAYTDFITFREKPLGKTMTDTAGNFRLTVDVDKIQPVVLKIGKVKGDLFVQPGGEYTVYVPPFEGPAVGSLAEKKVSLEFYLKDSLDINALIINYNAEFDKFWSRYYQYFLAKKSKPKLDSFKLAVRERYAKIPQPYFHTHVDYAIAAIEANTFGRGDNNIARDYILGRPVKYDNLEYMNFFNEFFKGYLQEFALSEQGQKIPSIVNNNPSYQELMDIARPAKYLRSDTLRELVLLKGLWEFYYSGNYSKEGIVSILEEMAEKAKVPGHRSIAQNMLASFPRIMAGKKAPEFVLRDMKGNEVKLSSCKGKYVYLNFWSSTGTTSQQEMKVLQDYRKKYGSKIVFISISTDKTKEEARTFLAKNPKCDWLQLYCDDEALKETYELRAVPAYYLIDDKGYFYKKAPADGPPAIEEVLYRISKPKEKKQGVGEKQNQH